ncbi:MAG: hypothetical protein NTV63_05265 [Candidatus Woesearchaeota archaeon]|nr:hypothetical protein [Candidatus Woesearchaeota archaeon]
MESKRFMDKKGVFFTIDALLASTIILSGIILVSIIYSSSVPTQNLEYISNDMIVSLSSVKASELNSSYLKSLIALGQIKNSNLNSSALELIGDFWAEGNMAVAQNLAREFLNLSLRADFESISSGIFINGQPIYEHNVSNRSSDYLVSSFRLVSGINESSPREGYSSRAILSAIRSKSVPSYAYFGGLVGQGNITQFIMLPSNYINITEAYLEFSTESPFSLSINGNSAGNLSCLGGGFMHSQKCYLNSSKFSLFQPGRNTMKIYLSNSSQAYVSGGFLRVKTETSDLNYSDVYYDSQLNTASKTEYLPGVDSVINIYSSFYALGNITSLELFLNYTTAPPLFVNIGGVVVYYSTQNGSVSVLLNNSNLSSSLNYSAISDKTIPIKIGHYALEQLSNITGGNADVILITDVSGSMSWQVGDYTANNTYNWTSADLETTIEQFKTSAAVTLVNTTILSDGFEEGTTLSNWTKTSSGYVNTAAQKHAGTFSQLLASSLSTKYLWSKSGILNTSGCSKVYVSFWTRDDDLDAGNINLFFNDSSGNWDNIQDLTQWTEDNWNVIRTYSTNDSQYLHAGFSIRFGGTTGSGENHWLDDVTVICEKITSYTATAEQNSTAVNYSAGGVNYQVVTAVKAIITIDSYNPAASNTTYANNLRPDLQVAFYNGTGYVAYSNCSVSASMGNNALNTIDWNCIISANNAAVLSAWNTAANRKIQVRAINLDAYNNLIYDEINVSAVYLNVSGYSITVSPADHTGETVACNDPNLYQNDTSRISLAKCLDNQFIDIIMNSSGNKLWLVDFNDHANSYYSTSSTALKNQVDSYNPSGGTCICCAINIAYNLLNSSSNSSRNKYVLVMSDGITGYRCTSSGSCSSSYKGNSTTGSECCGGNSGDCANTDCNGAILNANYSSSRVHESLNATVYSVGFGPLGSCYNANRTLVMVAQSGNGSVYMSSNPTELLEFYQQIATTIVNQSLVYTYQIVSITGVNSTLYPNSYLRINYTPSSPQFIFGKIPITLESQQFGNYITSGTLQIPEGFAVSDAKVTSYSGYYWTHNLTVNSVRVFSLSAFGSNYSSLGDPFLVSIPTSALHSGNNPISISVGTSSTKDFGGSPDDRIIYTMLMNSSISYSSVQNHASGCIWLLEFNDGTNSTIRIPQDYSGSSSCIFRTSSYDSGDAVNVAVYNIFRQLDINSDGILDVNIGQESLLVDSITISGVPSMWGPARIEARVWK